MAKVTIAGVGVLDGEYPLDFTAQPLTNWDFHLIKQVAGVRAGELEEAAEAGDLDLIVAFAVIALVRTDNAPKARAVEVGKMLMEADAGKVLYVEDDVGPPAVASPSENEHSGASEKHTGSSSNGSQTTGDDLPVSLPPPIGHHV